jgi:hypothetical protein
MENEIKTIETILPTSANIRSANTINLSEALIKAQIEYEPIIRCAKGFKSNYAPLDIVYKATRKPLATNFLAVYQQIDININNQEILITTLEHFKSGEYITSRANLGEKALQIYQQSNAKNNIIQDWGSLVTYFRRYNHLLIIGAMPEDEDNDGNYSHSTPNGNSNNGKIYSIDNNNSSTVLKDLIEKNDCDVVEFTKYFSIKSSDISSVNNAIKNINEMVSTFKNREVKVHNEEGKEAS